MRGVISQTQVFGATAAGLRCDAVSWVLATVAASRLRAACTGYFNDFGAIAKQECSESTFQASTDTDQILGFDLNTGKSDWGTRLAILGITAEFKSGNKMRKAGFALLLAGVGNPMGEVSELRRLRRRRLLTSVS